MSQSTNQSSSLAFPESHSTCIQKESNGTVLERAIAGDQVFLMLPNKQAKSSLACKTRTSIAIINVGTNHIHV